MANIITFWNQKLCLDARFVFSLFIYFLFLATLGSLQELSSPARRWTRAPCSGSWSSNPWTTREVPTIFSLF